MRLEKLLLHIEILENLENKEPALIYFNEEESRVGKLCVIV